MAEKSLQEYRVENYILYLRNFLNCSIPAVWEYTQMLIWLLFLQLLFSKASFMFG